MKRYRLTVLLAAVMLCGTLSVSCHKNEELGTDPVGPDRTLPYQLTDWMAKIADDKYLSEVTIPGTHDCGADLHTSKQGEESGYTICQNFRLENQLNLGVRWFDVRLRLHKGSLTVHHGDYYLHKNFGDLLAPALAFVKAHPTEAVVFMIKQEKSSESDHDFQQAVMDKIWAQTNWESYFYLVPGRVPKMGEVRGRIVLVRWYDNALNVGNPGLKFDWDDNTTGALFTHEGVNMYVQDHYKLNTVSYSTKCDEIKDCVRKAQADADQQKFYLNFTSGEQVVGQVTLESTSVHINPVIDEWLCTPVIYRKCGIIMVNFAGGTDDDAIGPWLVHDIIQCNDPQITVGNAPFQQTWKAQNLDVDHYRNGEAIPCVTDPYVWDTLTTGAYCYYGNDGGHNHSGNGIVYGKLYNWYAVHDPRGLAPAGWHVATVGDWTILVDFHGGWNAAGGKLKEAGSEHWMSPNTGATDDYGFSARPAGYRTGNGGSPEEQDVGRSEYGRWWTTDEASGTTAKYLGMSYFSGAITQAERTKTGGYSVRCVKDQ